MFGSPPQLRLGVNDTAGVLTQTEASQVQAALIEFANEFPQMRYAVVTAELPNGAPIATYATWIFNRSGMQRPDTEPSANRNVLLVVDTGDGRASLQTGYGLEPFVGEEQINSALQAGQARFQAGQFAPGIKAVIEASSVMLRDVWNRLGISFGIDMSEIQREEAAKLGLTIQAPRQQAKSEY